MTAPALAHLSQDVLAALLAAMTQAAGPQLKGALRLASFAIECGEAPPSPSLVCTARLTRATRTMFFTEGEARTPAGQIYLAGSAVFQLLGPQA